MGQCISRGKVIKLLDMQNEQASGNHAIHEEGHGMSQLHAAETVLLLLVVRLRSEGGTIEVVN